MLPFKAFLRGGFSCLFRTLGISCAACRLWLFPCLLTASSAQLSRGRFRSQPGGFLEKCERLIPNFSPKRDLLISFMLSLISGHRGPACIVLTWWNFLCGETYVADSLHHSNQIYVYKKTLRLLSSFSPPLPTTLNLVLLQNTSHPLERAAAHRAHRSCLQTGSSDTAFPRTVLSWGGSATAEK